MGSIQTHELTFIAFVYQDAAAVMIKASVGWLPEPYMGIEPQAAKSDSIYVRRKLIYIRYVIYKHF